MGRRCPQCEKFWPDVVERCPLDNEPLGSPVSLTDHKMAMGDALRSALSGQARPVEKGDLLGRYRLVESLATGGMAVVFRAVHEDLGREAAIKVLHPELSNHAALVGRFFQEARTVNRVRHPNIVEIQDLVAQGDHPAYMVMELLHGRELLQHINDRAPMEPREVVEVSLQIVSALHAVHQVDVIHRDLKAENIFLVRDHKGRLQVKLLDFGLAKWLAFEDRFVVTQTGEMVGTPEYMAPEQIVDGTADRRTDVYAVGVLMFEMLTGRLPFTGSMFGDLLQSQVSKAPPRPTDVLAAAGYGPVPGRLERIILQCLEKNPRLRFQTMTALQHALKSFQTKYAPARSNPPRVKRSREKKAEGNSHRYLLWLAAACLAAAGIVTLLLFSQRCG